MSITSEYLQAVNDFAARLNRIDAIHGTFAIVEAHRLEITAMGSTLKTWARTVILTEILLQSEEKNHA